MNKLQEIRVNKAVYAAEMLKDIRAFSVANSVLRLVAAYRMMCKRAARLEREREQLIAALINPTPDALRKVRAMKDAA